MKTLIFPGTALALLLTASVANGQTISARIDSVFSGLNRADGPGCTAAVFREGEIVFAKGYGMSNLEYGIPLTPGSVFHAASISKQFTAFAVELLVSEGRVTWDDQIQTYVPEIPEYDKAITLRHLVHHSSGIRDQWSLLDMAGWRSEADLITQQNALKIISRQTALNFDPGDEFLYSNSGYTLLATVVERVTGQTLRQFSEEHIFVPLGMTSTHFRDDHQTIVFDRAYGYLHWGDQGWKTFIPDFAITGATGLFTTVEDMARWDASLRDRTLGDDALYERFLERGVLTNGDRLTYAHGISVSDYRGRAVIGHGGGDAGYRTDYRSYPELEVGIAIFCNFARANPARWVRRIADIVLEDRFNPVTVEDDEAPPTVDPDEWADSFERLAGFYRDPRQDRPIHLWVHEGLARLQPGVGHGESGRLLVPTGKREFTLWPGGEQLRTSTEAGSVPHLEFDGVRHERIGPPVGDVDPAPYVGSYWSEELGSLYQVEPGEEPRSLRLVHQKYGPRDLQAVFEDGFVWDGWWVTFQRDANGSVNGFTWSAPRARKVKFVRRSEQ